MGFLAFGYYSVAEGVYRRVEAPTLRQGAANLESWSQFSTAGVLID
jgi:hypothetical protein